MVERLFSLKYLILTITLGLIGFYLYPQMDIQPYLAQGDHGRDLYVFERTLHGDRVYADYWWVYGPLMPKYYAFFFKTLGIQVPSIILGQQTLILISTLFFFLILTHISSPITASLGTLFYVVFRQEFFYTYNHTGGVCLSIVIIYFLLRYIQSLHLRYAYYGLTAVFALGLIKINFGVTALVALIGGMIVTHWIVRDTRQPQPTRFYALALFGIPTLLGIVYYLLLKDQPLYVIRQCFPYLAEDHPHKATLAFTLRQLWYLYATIIKSHWSNVTITGLSVLTMIIGFLTLCLKPALKINRKELIIFIIVLLGYTIINAHEYLVSGVFYRTYWAQPMVILLGFTFFGICAENYSRMIKFLLCFLLTGIIVINAQETLQHIAKVKTPDNYFSLPKAKVFLPTQASWIHTVELTEKYLSVHMDEDDSVFALPYDTIYNYILQTPSPTRQLIFFEHINIPMAQERMVIKNLKNNNVKWIVISSRMKSTEKGLGEFGKDYCPLIYKYIQAHYESVVEFGDWKNPPGWTSPHGTRIYRRIASK